MIIYSWVTLLFRLQDSSHWIKNPGWGCGICGEKCHLPLSFFPKTSGFTSLHFLFLLGSRSLEILIDFLSGYVLSLTRNEAILGISIKPLWKSFVFEVLELNTRLSGFGSHGVVEQSWSFAAPGFRGLLWTGFIIHGSLLLAVKFFLAPHSCLVFMCCCFLGIVCWAHWKWMENEVWMRWLSLPRWCCFRTENRQTDRPEMQDTLFEPCNSILFVQLKADEDGGDVHLCLYCCWHSKDSSCPTFSSEQSVGGEGEAAPSQHLTPAVKWEGSGAFWDKGIPKKEWQEKATVTLHLQTGKQERDFPQWEEKWKEALGTALIISMSENPVHVEKKNK